MNRFFIALISALLILCSGCQTGIHTPKPIQVEVISTNLPSANELAKREDAEVMKWLYDVVIPFVGEKKADAQNSPHGADKLIVQSEPGYADWIVHSEHEVGCIHPSAGHLKNERCVIPGFEERTTPNHSQAEPTGVKITVNGKEYSITKLDLEITPIVKVGQSTITISDAEGELLTKDEIEQIQVILDADGESEQSPVSMTDKIGKFFWDLPILAAFGIIVLLVLGIIFGIVLYYRRTSQEGEGESNTPPTPPTTPPTPPTTPPTTTGAVANIGDDPKESPVSDRPQGNSDEDLDNSVICDQSEVFPQPAESTDGLTMGRIHEDVSGLQRAVQLIEDRLKQFQIDSKERNEAISFLLHNMLKQNLKLAGQLGNKIDGLDGRTASVERQMTSVMCMTTFSHSQLQVLSDQLLLEAANRRLERQSS